MIQPNELRIGNWVKSGYYDDEKTMPRCLKIDTICSDFCGYNDTQGVKYTDIVGLPLTPEILEKCGFEKSSDYDKEYIISANDAYLHINPTNGDVRYGKWEHWCGCDCWSTVQFDVVNVESVHQLQNLYFALTGTELKINL